MAENDNGENSWQLAIPPREQLQHDAEWAQKFRGGTTNLGLRARHNEDRLAYVKALQDEQIAQERDLLQKSKTAQDLFFRSRKHEMDRKGFEAGMQERAMRMQHAEELHPHVIESKLAQTSAALARERATLSATALQAKKDRLEGEHTIGFSTHMSELLDRTQPGTDDYKIGILKGVEAFPHADNNIVTRYASPAIEGDEDLAAAMQAIPPGYTASQIRRGVNGKWGFVAKAPGEKSEAEMRTERKAAVDTWSKDRDHWQQERIFHMNVARDADGPERAEAERRATEAQTQLDRLNAQDPRSAAAPKPPPVVDANKIALARRALDDASASEAHKAAARKILGLAD